MVGLPTVPPLPFKSNLSSIPTPCCRKGRVRVWQGMLPCVGVSRPSPWWARRLWHCQRLAAPAYRPAVRPGAMLPRMTIVSYDHRPKRARKRRQPVAIPLRIVTAKKPKPGPVAPAIDEAVTERKPPSRPATITGSRIVTARSKPGRFGPVQDLDAEEHRRRGDAAEALFREIVRRVMGDAGS
jgi:hypothetical protein